MLLPILLLSIKLKSRPLTNDLIILFVSVTLSPRLGSSVLWVRPEMVTLACLWKVDHVIKLCKEPIAEEVEVYQRP